MGAERPSLPAVLLPGRVAQLDGLAVGCGARRAVPLLLAGRQLGDGDETLGRHQLLEGGEPVMVVARAVVRLAALAGGGNLTRQAGGPLLPGEVAGLVQLDPHGE